MKNNKNFLLMEGLLGIMALVLALLLLNSQTSAVQGKISVILPDSDNSRWSALKYGLKMAAKDQQVELAIVDTGESLTAKEQQRLLTQESDRGADGVLFQPVKGLQATELAKIEKQTPLMSLAAPLNGKTDTKIAQVTPDNYALGQTLGEAMRQDYADKLAGKTLGILMTEKESPMTNQRLAGLEHTLKATGIRLLWQVSLAENASVEEVLETKDKVDLLVALDDESLQLLATRVRTPVVYGVGHSTEALYGLDMGIVAAVVVPDLFQMGYQSVVNMTTGWQLFGTAKNQEVAFQVIRQEELFSKEHQELLFTMSQN